jgi:hypothetical protein
MNNDKIVEAAKAAHGKYWRMTGDESTGDKQSTAVTRSWQEAVSCETVGCEVPVAAHLNERIDVIDYSSKTAYELKVSGKNPQHEFYKDIFKVLVYNQNHTVLIERLIFLTESAPIERLKRGLGAAVIEMLSGNKLGITVIGI